MGKSIESGLPPIDNIESQQTTKPAIEKTVDIGLSDELKDLLESDRVGVEQDLEAFATAPTEALDQTVDLGIKIENTIPITSETIPVASQTDVLSPGISDLAPPRESSLAATTPDSGFNLASPKESSIPGAVGRSQEQTKPVAENKIPDLAPPSRSSLGGTKPESPFNLAPPRESSLGSLSGIQKSEQSKKPGVESLLRQLGQQENLNELAQDRPIAPELASPSKSSLGGTNPEAGFNLAPPRESSLNKLSQQESIPYKAEASESQKQVEEFVPDQIDFYKGRVEIFDKTGAATGEYQQVIDAETGKIEPIGSGGAADVYALSGQEGQPPAVLKLFKDKNRFNPEEEIGTLGALQDIEGVTKILGAGEIEGKPAIILENAGPSKTKKLREQYSAAFSLEARQPIREQWEQKNETRQVEMEALREQVNQAKEQIDQICLQHGFENGDRYDEQMDEDYFDVYLPEGVAYDSLPQEAKDALAKGQTMAREFETNLVDLSNKEENKEIEISMDVEPAYFDGLATKNENEENGFQEFFNNEMHGDDQPLGTLERMHEAGYVHLDLKPDNVCDKLIDYGAVKKIGDRIDRVQFTPGYAAREMLMKPELSYAKSRDIVAESEVIQNEDVEIDPALSPVYIEQFLNNQFIHEQFDLAQVANTKADAYLKKMGIDRLPPLNFDTFLDRRPDYRTTDKESKFIARVMKELEGKMPPSYIKANILGEPPKTPTEIAVLVGKEISDADTEEDKREAYFKGMEKHAWNNRDQSLDEMQKKDDEFYAQFESGEQIAAMRDSIQETFSRLPVIALETALDEGMISQEEFNEKMADINPDYVRVPAASDAETLPV